jgi:hypothetical protein
LKARKAAHLYRSQIIHATTTKKKRRLEIMDGEEN